MDVQETFAEMLTVQEMWCAALKGAFFLKSLVQ